MRRAVHAPKQMTRAQLAHSFTIWLASCRDKALDWPADELARSYGMKPDDVRAAVMAEKARRAAYVG